MRTKQTGFTLIEVMIAAVLLTLAFGALLLSFMRMNEMSTATRYSMDAMHIARNEIETLRATPYSDIISYTNIPLTNTVLEDLDGRKSCEVVTSTNHYKQIVLTITWYNPGKPNISSLELSTLISDISH